MKIGAFEFTEPIPHFEEPHVIAMLYPWLDAGSVGTLTLRRLERYFGSQELGKLEKPGAFFDFTRYRPTTRFRGGQRIQRVPNTRVSQLTGHTDPPIIVMQVREPHNNAEDYIASILEVLKALHVKRYSRIGAMYDAAPHTRPLQVSGNPQRRAHDRFARTRLPPPQQLRRPHIHHEPALTGAAEDWR